MPCSCRGSVRKPPDHAPIAASWPQRWPGTPSAEYAVGMSSAGSVAPPWFQRAVEVLELRRQDRLLLVLPGGLEPVRAVRTLVGSNGAITVLEPHRRTAEAIAEGVADAEVIALPPVAEERFGSFDAVLAAPFAGPLPELAVWGSLLANNLRPGGRFVVDLPAPDPLPDVTAAAATIGEAFAAKLRDIAGPAVEALAAVLTQAGMRRVEPLLGTHLLTLHSPLDLVDPVAAACRLAEDDHYALLDALTRRLQSTAASDALAQRSAVAGMR